MGDLVGDIDAQLSPFSTFSLDNVKDSNLLKQYRAQVAILNSDISETHKSTNTQSFPGRTAWKRVASLIFIASNTKLHLLRFVVLLVTVVAIFIFQLVLMTFSLQPGEMTISVRAGTGLSIRGRARSK